MPSHGGDDSLLYTLRTNVTGSITLGDLIKFVLEYIRFFNCQSKNIELFLLMTILSKAFFALVSCHLVAFSFLSAWHVVGIYFV